MTPIVKLVFGADYDKTRLTEIAALTARAEATPGRKPEAIKARLSEKIAELLDGFVVTENGWVQSYGSRCTRPPIVVPRRSSRDGRRSRVR